ncbi:adhesion G-protein coupled receptor G2-like [Lucilia sericata]|uniref:adhesion G-protein coupled receptor G2-like n=1 Tax=Lucilia sericata TaxID=13632 RepID=UPI0018A863F0|nr:adhesion G-protein coupled receptor G2-like [Lucilia sericata]
MKFYLILLAIFLFIYPTIGVHQCEKQFFKTVYHDGYSEISVLLIWFPVSAGSQSTLRVCSNETGLPLQRHCTYERSSNTSTWEEINGHIKLLNCSSIDTVCREEPFRHNYVMKNNVIKSFENKWKSAKISELADLKEPCLLRSGLPITRLCSFNSEQMKAQWELLSPQMRNISCMRETREDVITYDLSTLYKEVKDDEKDNKVKPNKVVKEMTDILQKSNAIRVPADIKISSDILKIITEENRNPELLTSVLKVTDVILDTKPQIVIMSEEVNATSTLLKTIDTYLHNMAEVLVPPNHCHNILNGTFYKKFNHTSVFYINPSCSNISGIAIYKSNSSHLHYDAHSGQRYRFLYLNESLDDIQKEPNLYLATYFPLKLWNRLNTETDGTVLIFIIFKNDLLFVNHTKMLQKPRRNVLEIAVQNYTGELPEDIPFILRYRPTSAQPPICGYWNYNKWITDGVETNYSNISNNLLICRSRHLTHFASLFAVSSESSLSTTDLTLLSISHDMMLDYITILGCGLSMVGLSFIWLTAIWFKNWRAQESNQVLMNVCFVLTLLMIFFLILNIPDVQQNYLNMRDEHFCMIMGASLHYIVLVLFFWMLIIAVMQYQRYVKVLGYARSPNYIIKYALVAWGIPLIPAILVAYFDPETYKPPNEKVDNNSAICYPSGFSLYYGVILPMAAIILVNIGIFIYIVISLRRSMGLFKRLSDKKNMILQVRISILLFFLLGISWIFGFLTHLERGPVFSYLFCLTSTLQGFVLFLYSIVIDKSTRLSWTMLCCAKNYNTMENSNSVHRENRFVMPTEFVSNRM